MDQQLVETIRQRIALLASERQQYAQQAQRIDYGYAAAIGELQHLLAQIEAPPAEPTEPELSALEEELTDLDDEEESESNA